MIQPLFKVGDNVLALEPNFPRYFGGRVHRVINTLPREDGGPLYEVHFFQDGNNESGRSFILPEHMVYEKVRIKKHNDWTEVYSTGHSEEFPVEEVLRHRTHQHGRLPCPYTKKDALSRCKMKFDYEVMWVGRDELTWETELSFVVFGY